jgi:hypothetical protein
VGSALDIGWVPLPWPIGGGSVLGVALRDGSLAFVETCQARGRVWGDTMYKTSIGLCFYVG